MTSRAPAFGGWVGRALLGAAILLAFAAPASAQREPPVRLSTTIGFGGVYRTGAWTPVFVTLQARTPRAVLIELSFAHDQVNAMRVVQAASANAEPSTYLLLAPAPGDVQGGRVVIRDAQSGRTLADAPLYDPANRTVAAGAFTVGPFGASDNEVLVGHSGSGSPPAVDVGNLPNGRIIVGSLPPAQLPASAVGYEGLDLLILGAADLARMDAAVQRAIVDWVYAGGTLLCWPGTAPLPPPAASPVVELLPVEVADARVTPVTPADRATLGLPDRFERLPTRHLLPHADARPLDVLGTSVRAYWADRGIGRVLVLPFDPTLLPLSAEARPAFWRPPLQRLLGDRRIPNPATAAEATGDRMGRFANWARVQGQSVGLDAAVNAIGNIPGIGRFGFSWVLLVLLGLMVVVGPVDWWILKKLGRQPWTIFTTAGWIALVTVGAVYLGNVVRSGDLHLRTIELVEQAGGRVVARTHVAVAYSPRTARYDITTPPETWWRPAASQMYFVSGTLKTDIPFRQAAGGNRPAPSTINIWSLRLLRGDEVAAAPAFLEADLRQERRDGRPWLVGTVKNLSDVPLQGVTISTRSGSLFLPSGLPPGGSATVDGRLDPHFAAALADPDAANRVTVPPAPVRPVSPTDDPAAAPAAGVNVVGSDWAAMFGLDPARNDRLVTRVYGREDGSPPLAVLVAAAPPEARSPVGIAGESPVVQHTRVIRATFPLAAEANP